MYTCACCYLNAEPSADCAVCVILFLAAAAVAPLQTVSSREQATLLGVVKWYQITTECVTDLD